MGMSGHRRPLAILVGATVLLGGCGFGAGATREELVNRLVIQADLDGAEAECVAEALYDRSGLDEADISQFTLNPPDEPGPAASAEERDAYTRYQTYLGEVDEAVRTCITG